MHQREFDLILYGASGFTGRLVADYLFRTYGNGAELKWAMAGRNREKLEQVRAEMADASVAIVIADSQDEEALRAMVRRTKVICTTVGPYAKYGSKLVAACVALQTHYCDLTGEVQWMRRMIDAHHEQAEAEGTKIVHTCGFDSIPSDLGVYYVQQQARAQSDQRAQRIKMRVAAIRGGVSGGTYASLTNVLAEAEQDKSIYSILFDPYGLNPEGKRQGPDRQDLAGVKYDETAESWIFPFIMANINTKVVRRSNALLDYSYGKDFRYEEATLAGGGLTGRLKAYAAALPLGLMMAAKPGTLLKKLFDRLLPAPGEGPGEAAREAGFYKFRFYTTLEDGSQALGTVTGDRDPGYGSTCKMLAESAVCLAKDDLPERGGVLTPSVAMGDALLRRLEENAGLTFGYKVV